MSNSQRPAGSTADPEESIARAPAHGVLAVLRRLIVGERVCVLRELDDFLLRDIGASGEDIWRVRRLRNGERPTLLVG